MGMAWGPIQSNCEIQAKSMDIMATVTAEARVCVFSFGFMQDPLGLEAYL